MFYHFSPELYNSYLIGPLIFLLSLSHKCTMIYWITILSIPALSLKFFSRHGHHFDAGQEHSTPYIPSIRPCHCNHIHSIKSKNLNPQMTSGHPVSLHLSSHCAFLLAYCHILIHLSQDTCPTSSPQKLSLTIRIDNKIDGFWWLLVFPCMTS